MKDLLIVVPYRNREEHLACFLEKTPSFFDKTNLTYDILICELDEIGDWNAGLCVNSLIDFINQDRQYEWLYIHHVDIWPSDGEWAFPKEKEVYFNMGDYGSCLMKLSTFFEVDGYSNSFWGWGGEDNELYQKLKEKGYQVSDYATKEHIKYNTKFQDHPRKFNGKNYANAIKQSMIVPKQKRTNIKDFSSHAFTKNLKELSNNVFKQIVCPKQKSPNETINKYLILTYVDDTSNFDNFVSYVKSAQLHAAYEFDMAAIVKTNEKDSWCINQLETFGIQCVFPHDESKSRYEAFKAFIQNNNNYEFILTVPIEDLYFQSNPFYLLDKENLSTTDKNEQIFAGPKKDFLNHCESLINLKKINHNNFHNDFFLDLKTAKNPKIIGDRRVLNELDEKYSIILNYSTYPALKQTVDNHFKTYYFPL